MIARQAIAHLRGVPDLVGGWVLRGNVRSQRFLTARGWVRRGLQSPPWQTTAAFFATNSTSDRGASSFDRI